MPPRLHCLVPLLLHLAGTHALGEVIYALNAGGEAHIDVYGVRYEKDPLIGKMGTASDFGKQLVIGRVPPGDQVLYQTERYHHSTFGYDIPLKGDGDYVLVLKFSEVYFNAPDQKVFDVVVNGDVTVVSGLDIFGRVGRGVAHDEYVPFTLSGSSLTLPGGRHTSLRPSPTAASPKLKVEFVKGYKDNPKVNAIFLIKGRLEDVPRLPPLPREEELEGENEDPVARVGGAQQPAGANQPGAGRTGGPGNGPGSGQRRRPSGPRTPDPYAADHTSSMLPVFVAVAAAVPILFCLCKL